MITPLTCNTDLACKLLSKVQCSPSRRRQCLPARRRGSGRESRDAEPFSKWLLGTYPRRHRSRGTRREGCIKTLLTRRALKSEAQNSFYKGGRDHHSWARGGWEVEPQSRPPPGLSPRSRAHCCGGGCPCVSQQKGIFWDFLPICAELSVCRWVASSAQPLAAPLPSALQRSFVCARRAGEAAGFFFFASKSVDSLPFFKSVNSCNRSHQLAQANRAKVLPSSSPTAYCEESCALLLRRLLERL